MLRAWEDQAIADGAAVRRLELRKGRRPPGFEPSDTHLYVPLGASGPHQAMIHSGSELRKGTGRGY
jgi:hypothetical protein